MSTPQPTLHVLSAGACQGLVKDLRPEFSQQSGAAVEAVFGAVGAMREALLGGSPCDVMIVSEAVAERLAESGHLDPRSFAPVGDVETGIGIRSGDQRPDVSTPDRLAETLRTANGIYTADPERATGGIHFAAVLRNLGIYDEVEARLRIYPNGATLMRELAAATGPGLLGCSQVTEIIYTDGVEVVGPLPAEHGLTTRYVATRSASAAEPDLAAAFIASLTGAALASQRAAAGFLDPDPLRPPLP